MLVFETKITSRCNTENFFCCFWKSFIMSPLFLQFDKDIVHIYCYRCEITLPVLFFAHLTVASTWFTASVPDLLQSPEIQCFSILLILSGVSFLLQPSSSVAYQNFVSFLFSRWLSHFIPLQKIIILMKDIVKINSFYMITHRSSHWEVLCWIDTPLTNNRITNSLIIILVKSLKNTWDVISFEKSYIPSVSSFAAIFLAFF